MLKCYTSLHLLYYTTVHTFNDLFSRTTWVSGSPHQIGKPFRILLMQEMIGWQWHQLDHMQIICTSLQTDNHTSSSLLSFYKPDALPAAQPTASAHFRQELNEWEDVGRRFPYPWGWSMGQESCRSCGKLTDGQCHFGISVRMRELHAIL